MELLKTIAMHHSFVFLWHFKRFQIKNELILTSEQTTGLSVLALLLAYLGQIAASDARGIVAKARAKILEIIVMIGTI